MCIQYPLSYASLYPCICILLFLSPVWCILVYCILYTAILYCVVWAWNQHFAINFQNFLLVIGSVFIPAFAVLIADYFLIHKGDYAVDELLSEDDGRSSVLLRRLE